MLLFFGGRKPCFLKRGNGVLDVMLLPFSLLELFLQML
jgi:hypothetical protein